IAIDVTVPDGPRGRIATQGLELDEVATSGLAALARATHTTPSVVLQAAWSYLLHHYSGDPRVVHGITVSGRPPQLPGVEQMMGLFINTLPCSVDFEPGLTVAELLKRIHAAGAARDEYGYLSLADVQRQTAIPKGTALFDTLLVFQNTPGRRGGSGGARPANAIEIKTQLEGANSAF